MNSPVPLEPGSTTVSTLLMQDTVVANSVSVEPARPGSLGGKAALFANPCSDGKFTFAVICSNSYGPPQESDPQWLTIKVE